MKTPINIKKLAEENKAFRKVMDTGKFGQLVLMSLSKGEKLGDEVHPTADEFYYIVEGEGEIRLDGKPYPFTEHSAMLVPAGVRHDIVNIGKDELKLFAVFTSRLHPENEVIATREKAFAGKH